MSIFVCCWGLGWSLTLLLNATLPFFSDAHYLTCRIQECAETTRSGPFARSIDISSLVVQDEYIFIQVSVASAADGRKGDKVRLAAC